MNGGERNCTYFCLEYQMPVIRKDLSQPSARSPMSKSSKFTARAYVEPIGEGFVIPKRKKPQSVGIIIGDGGSGKTTFITRYCPGPIALFTFDGRSDEAIQEAQETRGEGIIQEFRIDFPFDAIFLNKDRAMKAAKTALDQYFRGLKIACDAAKQGQIVTIGHDTGTELNDLFQIYARGDLETTKPEGDKGHGDRGASKFIINRQWLTIFQMVRASGANFIVIGRPKQKWVDNAPVKDTFLPYLPEVCNDATDWTGRISPIVVPATRKTPAEVSFEIKISKAGPNITQLGRVYSSREWEPEGGPFAYISSQMYQKVEDKSIWLP